MRKIAILGCGPAGLLAAHAVARTGVRPTIFSRAVPSAIGGAQFLHCAIPDITDTKPDGLVQFAHFGSEDVYAEKVYGDPHAKTSWGEYHEGEHPIWNMRRAYDNLWTRYESSIVDQEVDNDRLDGILRQYDLVISSIPPHAFCHFTFGQHAFVQQPVSIVYGEEAYAGSDLILYNGDRLAPFYRASWIFGWVGWEYSPEQAPPNAVTIQKPLSTTCDCYPSVLRVGRYGRYEKGVLIHHAFSAVEAALAGVD